MGGLGGWEARELGDCSRTFSLSSIGSNPAGNLILKLMLKGCGIRHSSLEIRPQPLKTENLLS